MRYHFNNITNNSLYWVVNKRIKLRITSIQIKNKFNNLSPFQASFFSTKVSEPLRILFFGSDHFSSASLRAIYNEQKKNPNLIKSIDVACRPGKPVGRGLKKIAKAPIKILAREIGLPIHEIDKNANWQLPKPDGEAINLIIAVSFGLFIPSQVLASVKYGGLNLHPSLLPDFRGPAPLQRMLLAGQKFTGVSLQTLHHKSFDQGIILHQTVPWIEIPDLCTYDRLLELLTPIAAKMLVEGLIQRLFVPPLQSVGWIPQKGQKLTYASKITTADSKVHWQAEDGAISFVRTYCALGPLWSYVYVRTLYLKRLIFDDIELGTQVHCNSKDIFDFSTTIFALEKSLLEPVFYILVSTATGENKAIFYYECNLNKGSVYFLFPGKDPGVWSSARVGKVTIEGKSTVPAKKALKSVRQDENQYLETSYGESIGNPLNIMGYPFQD